MLSICHLTQSKNGSIETAADKSKGTDKVGISGTVPEYSYAPISTVPLKILDSSSISDPVVIHA